MKRLRPHLTYANLASSLALLAALSTGGAWAASRLAPKSVGERQLRAGAVTAAKLRKNAVTSPKLAAEAVTLGKIGQGAVDASRLAPGAVGAFQLAGGAVITEKLAAGAVTGEKVSESTLGQVPSAQKAESATTAESANPAAFAKVSAAGTLDAANSKGIAAVNEIEAGVYCVTVAAFAPTGAQITPQYNGIGSTDAFARIGGAASCPSPQIEVQTWNGGAKVEAPFFLVAYRQ
jgi:hypothetical protein